MKVETFKGNPNQWDNYVLNNPNASIYHLYAWGEFFKDIYKFKSINLVAYDGDSIVGIVQLILMKNHLQKKILVSLPYFCNGGILAENSTAEQKILEKIRDLITHYKCSYSLLRNENISNVLNYDYINKQKSSFVLQLDTDYNKVFGGFRKQIRRRIRKGYKSGCTIDLSKRYFNEFYDIYRINMRLLGSPAHKKSFYYEILNRFSENYNVLVVLFENKVIGAQLLSYFKNTVYLPLASSLREYNKYSPSHLLYWESIKFGCENGYHFCDFGRSTIGSGPHIFKKQWNATVTPLDYCYMYPDGRVNKNDNSYGELEIVSRLWKRMPLKVTNFLGPYLSKGLP